jgi:hypothetical protein
MRFRVRVLGKLTQDLPFEPVEVIGPSEARDRENPKGKE